MRQLPIRFFVHFCCRMYRLATKHTEKTELEKRQISLFRHRQKPCGLDTGCYVTYQRATGRDSVVNKQVEEMPLLSQSGI